MVRPCSFGPAARPRRAEPDAVAPVRPSLCFLPPQAENDRRFADKGKKYLKATTFPASFSEKVDLRKVNVTVFRPWVVKRTEEMLGFEDEVVVEFVVRALFPAARAGSRQRPACRPHPAGPASWSGGSSSLHS